MDTLKYAHMQTFDPAASKQEFLKAAVNFWTLFNQMCHVGKIKLRFSEIQSIKNMNVILLTVCYCMAAALFCLSQNLGSQQSLPFCGFVHCTENKMTSQKTV